MGKESLRKLLGQLEDSLSEVDGDDQEVRARLKALTVDLEQYLDSQDEDEADESLAESLKMQVSEFEQEHPGAAGVIRQIMQTLSNMGI